MEFLDIDRPYIYLWDDNFLSYKDWESILNELEKTNKPFQFRQGLDLRIMNERMAQRLSTTKYKGDFIFAFDHVEEKELIESKLKLWKKYSSKTTKLYVLCAFDSQDEIDITNTFERIKILMRNGCLPYIMRYESYKSSIYKNLYTQVARWCNQPQFFKKMSFRQFCEANQDYHKSDTHCSAYKSMLEFEKEFPDIAKDYFDLRFEDMNLYSVNFGYGRKYANKRDCTVCSSEQKTWVEAYIGNIKSEEVLLNYFSKEIDLQCLTYVDAMCESISNKKISEWLCNLIAGTSWDTIISLLDKFINPEEVNQENIPQYSDLFDATINVLEYAMNDGNMLTFEKMGYYLDGKSKNKVARVKYGENHSKFATLIDLLTIHKNNNKSYVRYSVMGNAFNDLNDVTKNNVLAKLMFRIPIIQKFYYNAIYNDIISLDEYFKDLSPTTANRRRPNVVGIIDFIGNNSNEKLKEISRQIR